MNKYQVAMGIIAAAEAGKTQSVASKRRAGTKRAGYKTTVDGLNASIASSIDRSRYKREVPRTVSSYGPKQSIKVWREI